MKISDCRALILVHSRPCPTARHLDTPRKILVFRYTNSLSTLFYHPCHSLFFDRAHLRFAVQYGDHFRSGIICSPIWGSFAVRDHLWSWDHLRTRTVTPHKTSQQAHARLATTVDLRHSRINTASARYPLTL